MTTASNAAKQVAMGAWPAAVLPSVAASVTAAGNSLSTATALTADINVITACTATSADGVRLPAARSAGDAVLVVNYDADAAAKVYPATSGGKINNGSAGASVTLNLGFGALFVSLGSENWIRVGHLTA